MARNDAVRSFIEMKTEMLKDRKDDRRAAIDEILRILQSQSDNKEAALLGVQAVIADIGSSGTLRLRDTSLVDKRVTGNQEIQISVLPNPSLPANFAFGLTKGSAERSVAETEIEAVFAFPTSEFAKGLLDVARGDNAIAIINSLKDLISQPQA